MGLAFAVGLIGALLFLREPAEKLSAEALASARRRWEAAGVRDYDMTFRMHGSLYEVACRDGIVGRMLVNGRSPETVDASAYTVDGLFRVLEQELDAIAEAAAGGPAGQGGVMARVRFHPALGYVERYVRGGGGMGRSASIELLSFSAASRADSKN